MRMQSQEQEFIIAKFKRHGHPITRKSLEKAVLWLKQQPSHSLDILLKKLSQLAINNNNLDDNLQHAIEILSFKNKNLNSYEDLLEDTRKRCIFYLSPYEYDNQTWFKERPEPRFFEFNPEQKLKNSQHQFKRISDTYKDLGRQLMLGLIYQNYFSFSNEGKQRLVMQNQVTEIELNFPSNFKSECLLIPGCTYIAKGRQQGKNLAFKVQQITLPLCPGEKQTLIKSKFKQMCQNISAGKQTTGYQPYDFVKYDCVYTPPLHPNKPTLIFGNITLNKKTIERLKRLIDAYPNGVASIILLLSPDIHEQVDFTVWLKCKVYLVPHITADGPRILPKLPLLKIHFPGAKVVTNPVRFNIEGKELIVANYPLIRSILSHAIILPDQPQLQQENIISKVTDLVFSQGTIGLAYDHYWPQACYFNITNDSIVVVTDGVTATVFKDRKKLGLGGLANTGNFDRDGDFICLMSRAKEVIQLCGQMLQ